MGSRAELNSKLKELCPNVYFQPPASITMQYPCIVYTRGRADTKFADNTPYSRTKRYQVTVIDRDPDSHIPDEVAKLPLTEHDSFFVVDNLNHDVFTTFF